MMTQERDNGRDENLRESEETEPRSTLIGPSNPNLLILNSRIIIILYPHVSSQTDKESHI